MSDPISICVDAGLYSSTVSQADADAKALAAAQALAIEQCPGVTPPFCSGGTDPTPPSLVSTTPVSVGTRDLIFTGPNPTSPPNPSDVITWDILSPGFYHIDYISGFWNINHTYPPTVSNDNHYTGGGAWAQLLYTNLTFNVQIGLPQTQQRGNALVPTGHSCSSQPDIDIPELCADIDIEELTRANNPAYSFCVGRGYTSAGSAITQVWINTRQRDLDQGVPQCPDGNDCSWVPVTTGPVTYELIRDIGYVCDQPDRLRVKNWLTEVFPLLIACSVCRPPDTDPEDDPDPIIDWDGTFPYLNMNCPSGSGNKGVTYTVRDITVFPTSQYVLNNKLLGVNFVPNFFEETCIQYRTDGVTGMWVLSIVCRDNSNNDQTIWFGTKLTGCTGEGIYNRDTGTEMCSTMLDSVCVEAY